MRGLLGAHTGLGTEMFQNNTGEMFILTIDKKARRMRCGWEVAFALYCLLLWIVPVFHCEHVSVTLKTSWLGVPSLPHLSVSAPAAPSALPAGPRASACHSRRGAHSPPLVSVPHPASGQAWLHEAHQGDSRYFLIRKKATEERELFFFPSLTCHLHFNDGKTLRAVAHYIDFKNSITFLKLYPITSIF